MKHARKQTQRPTSTERGINLEVPGTELIAQADARIKWHTRMAATMEAELKTIERGTEGDSVDGFKRRSRRTDLEEKITAHLEFARFLAFVRRSLVPRRRYHVCLADLYSLELMPKGSYA